MTSPDAFNAVSCSFASRNASFALNTLAKELYSALLSAPFNGTCGTLGLLPPFVGCVGGRFFPTTATSTNGSFTLCSIAPFDGTHGTRCLEPPFGCVGGRFFSTADTFEDGSFTLSSIALFNETHGTVGLEPPFGCCSSDKNPHPGSGGSISSDGGFGVTTVVFGLSLRSRGSQSSPDRT
jgi:hypothetical protein